jgi:type I restriction enzyme R subunit
LPLVQIELKRRGLELKEAFNQINRYQRHSFGSNSALFQYIQIFIISNGVNTKYYANNRNQSFKQTFYWTDKENKRLTNILNGFTSEFLEPCHISKMICKYIVLNEAYKISNGTSSISILCCRSINRKSKKQLTKTGIYGTPQVLEKH